MQQEPDAEAFGLLLRLGKELWMSHAIEFIETSLFTRQIKSIATDDELKDLQKVIYFIMAYPKCIKDSLTETEKAELKKADFHSEKYCFQCRKFEVYYVP